MLRWSGAFAFTVLVPGTVTVLLPYYILDGSASLQEVRWGPTVITGGLVFLVGVGVYGRCLWECVQKGQGIPAPIDHPKELVVTGLYRYVRNPMYLGVLAILIGEVLTMGSRALLVYAAVWLLVVHIVTLVYEEPNLRARFGESYEQYCAHVRRWVPGPRSRPPAIVTTHVRRD